MCLRVLKESNKSRLGRYSRQKQCIDHIPYYPSGLSRAHFSDNLSRNSCMYKRTKRQLNTEIHYCLGGKEMASASNVAVTLAVIRPSVAI